MKVLARARLRLLALMALGVAAALPAAIWLWPFMVDDALISARYAAHLAAGHGYRFNVLGRVTDGVTPLGWAHLLAPFAAGGALSAFRFAKVLGLLAWLLSAGLLAVSIGRLQGGRLKWSALLLVASSAPLAAWSVAGMETGLVLALAGVAVYGRSLGREWLVAGAAALVAAWRPEAIVWALILVMAPAREPAASGRWLRLVVTLLPAGVVACLRWVFFGTVVPLAVMAKPSDLHHGLIYAGACLLLTGPLALLAWRALPPWIRGLQAAVAGHYLAMALAGGDWMPLSRLAVLAIPTTVIAAAHIAGRPGTGLAVFRIGVAVALQLMVLWRVGPRAAEVGPKRMLVISQLAPALRDARVTAALDVGWVGVATEAAVVDLAGVTDPTVAMLRGGHTSKRVRATLLSHREVDTLVLLLAKGSELAEPWHASVFARRVEQRVAAIAARRHCFQLRAHSTGPLRYLVLRRAAGDAPGCRADADATE